MLKGQLSCAVTTQHCFVGVQDLVYEHTFRCFGTRQMQGAATDDFQMFDVVPKSCHMVGCIYSLNVQAEGTTPDDRNQHVSRQVRVI